MWTRVFLQSRHVNAWWISQSSLAYIIHETLGSRYKFQGKRNTQLNSKALYCNGKVKIKGQQPISSKNKS